MQVKIDWRVFLCTSFLENWNIAPLTIVLVLGFPVIRSKLQNGRASASALSSVAGIVAPAYPHGLITRARLRAKKNRGLTYWSPSWVVTALRPTDPHWSLHTILRTSPSVISYCEIVPFYGMRKAPRSHFTDCRLKRSVALKTKKPSRS